MENIKKGLRCDECNGTIVKDEIRNEYYCEVCGLVYEPNHTMGRGYVGLKDYMVHSGLNDYVNDIQVTYNASGLAKARLAVAKL